MTRRTMGQMIGQAQKLTVLLTDEASVRTRFTVAWLRANVPPADLMRPMPIQEQYDWLARAGAAFERVTAPVENVVWCKPDWVEVDVWRSLSLRHKLLVVEHEARLVRLRAENMEPDNLG